MPYQTNQDLNAATKKAHPKAAAQTAFRKTFDHCVQSGKYTEQECFKISHSVARKKD